MTVCASLCLLHGCLQDAQETTYHVLIYCLFFPKAILESEPFSITLKDTTVARKLGEDFAKELGKYNSQNHYLGEPKGTAYSVNLPCVCRTLT